MTHESGARARREGGAWAVERRRHMPRRLRRGSRRAPNRRPVPLLSRRGRQPHGHAPSVGSAVPGSLLPNTSMSRARNEGDVCRVQQHTRGTPAELHQQLTTWLACACAGRAVARTGCCAQPCLGPSRRASEDEDQVVAVAEGVCEEEGRPRLAGAWQPRRGEAEEQVRDVMLPTCEPHGHAALWRNLAGPPRMQHCTLLRA